MEQVIEKLTAEIEKENNPYVKIIGEFLIKQVESNPSAAEKILVEEKTIKGSLKAMADEARKKAVNGMAILTDEEGFAIVLDYFGIEKKETVTKPGLTVIENDKNVTKKPKRTPKKKESVPDGQLDIFDVIGDEVHAN